MRSSILFLALILGFTLLGCHKDDESQPNNPTKNCKITKITSDTVGVVHITYTSDGKIRKISSDSSSSTFTYSSQKTIIVKKDKEGNMVQQTLIYLDGDGIIQKVVTNDVEANSTDTSRYLYSDSKVSKEITSYSDNTDKDTTVYEWENGNMVRTIEGKDTSTFTYYTDQAYQQGDFLNLFGLTVGGIAGGQIGFHSKNLIKGVTFQFSIFGFKETVVINADYEFDSEGKVTSSTATVGGESMSFNYDYECDE